MIDFIIDCVRHLRDWICELIQGVIDFLTHVVSWFRSLRLDKKKDIPFIMKGEKFREMLHQAPKKNVGLFEANYDEQADEITANRWLEADGVDAKTRQALNESEDGVLVLS